MHYQKLSCITSLTLNACNIRLVEPLVNDVAAQQHGFVSLTREFSDEVVLDLFFQKKLKLIQASLRTIQIFTLQIKRIFIIIQKNRTNA